MSAVGRSFALLRGSVAQMMKVPRAGISVKPAKNVISAGEQVFALTVMFVTILGPSGWVLAHLDDYKKR